MTALQKLQFKSIEAEHNYYTALNCLTLFLRSVTLAI